MKNILRRCLDRLGSAVHGNVKEAAYTEPFPSGSMETFIRQVRWEGRSLADQPDDERMDISKGEFKRLLRLAYRQSHLDVQAACDDIENKLERLFASIRKA